MEPVASFDGGLLRDQGIRCWCCDWRRWGTCRHGCSDGTGKPRIRVHCPRGESETTTAASAIDEPPAKQPNAKRSVQDQVA